MDQLRVEQGHVGVHCAGSDNGIDSECVVLCVGRVLLKRELI